MLEHPFGDMAGDVHDRLVARLPRFGKPSDKRVTVIVPTTFDTGGEPNLAPNGLKAGARLGWIGRLRLASREDEPFRLQLLEFLQDYS